MKLLARLEGRPFAIIGINSDEGDGASARVRDEGPAWRHAIDGSTRGPISTQWNIRLWPTMVLLDGDGIIRARGHSVAELEATLAALLPAK